MPRLTGLFLTLCLLSGAVQAHDDGLRYNRVNFSESARQEVDNDLLVVVVRAHAEGRDASAPADTVNREMDWAVSLVRAHPDVRTQTLGYSTQPVYEKGKITGWRVQQSLRLESRDSRLLGDLMGQLQARLQVTSVGYQVSDAARREHVETLTAAALARFQARAAQIAKSLGRSRFRIVQLHVDDGRDRPMPVARGLMMEAAADASVAPARLEGGTQTLSVDVNGEIELSED